MQIQLNADSHIQDNAALAEKVEAVVTATLDHLSERIAWVGVYLTDEHSAQQVGTQAIRCVIEARLPGYTPIAVTHQADSVEQAVGGTVFMLEHTLESTLDRLNTLQQESLPPDGAQPGSGPIS